MPKKIVLKIRNIEALDATTSHPVEETEVIYHWDRIFGALCFVLVVAVGLYLGVRHVLSGTEDSEAPVLAAVSSPPDVPPVESAAAQPATQEVQPAPQETDTLVSVDAPEEAQTEAPDRAQPAVVEPSAGTEVADTDAVPSGTDAVTATLPAPAAGLEMEARLPPAEIEVNTPSFTRVVLTSDVVEREPVDQLPGLLSMNDQGLLKVHLFTELVGQAGKVFYYRWYREGNPVATVRIPIGSHKARVSSSKFINRAMIGRWRVDVQNEAGALLARARFIVRE